MPDAHDAAVEAMAAALLRVRWPHDDSMAPVGVARAATEDAHTALDALLANLPEPPAPPEDCCCNAESKGRLCDYHAGVEAGWDGLAIALGAP